MHDEIGNGKFFGYLGFGIAGLALGYIIGKEAVDYATNIAEFLPDVISHIVSEYPLASKVISSLVAGRLFSGCGGTAGGIVDSLIEGYKESRSTRRYMREMKKAGRYI